ncbi:PspC domain-containing protein [Shewanella maritima]|uniref:PspC domain-containing protein n=1 Tax=Shewanella maritima TaxID=2520507 RepID=UPI00373553DE
MLDSIVDRLKNDKRIVCGVCARLAKQYDWSLTVTRLVAVVILLTNPSLTLLAYFIIAVIFTQKPTRY